MAGVLSIGACVLLLIQGAYWCTADVGMDLGTPPRHRVA